MTPAERKRLQRQRANVTKCHEIQVVTKCHETRDYQLEARAYLDSIGEPTWTNELRKYVLSQLLADLANDLGVGLLTAVNCMDSLPAKPANNLFNKDLSHV